MSKDNFERVRGSGNIFRDLGHHDADILDAKAVLAGKIIGVLDDRGISVRRAHELAGYAAADFSRARQAKLQRFTIERLISILVKLNGDVEVSIQVTPPSQRSCAGLTAHSGRWRVVRETSAQELALPPEFLGNNLAADILHKDGGSKRGVAVAFSAHPMGRTNLAL